MPYRHRPEGLRRSVPLGKAVVVEGSESLDADRLAKLGPEFLELSRMLMTDEGIADAARLVRLAAASAPHAAHCALTLLGHKTSAETLAATDDVALRVDALQHEIGQGPCVEAAVSEAVVLSEDLLQDPRWPAFSARCVAETGVRSMLCVQLPLTGAERAAINLYSPAPAAFGELDVGVATIFASFAAFAVNQTVRERDIAHFGAALTSSRQIGTAIGILMARYAVTESEAFGLLARASQHLNRKLRDVASDVVFTGVLPPEPTRQPPTTGRTAPDGTTAGPTG